MEQLGLLAIRELHIGLIKRVDLEFGILISSEIGFILTIIHENLNLRIYNKPRVFPLLLISEKCRNG